MKARNSQSWRAIHSAFTICLLSFAAYAQPGGTAQMSRYVFLSDQSTLVQTGGIAGVHWTYTLKGDFLLAVDSQAGTASFAKVNASAVTDSPERRTLDPNEVFNMTALAGTVVDGGQSIRFEGSADDTSSVLITLTFAGDTVTLKGQTTPPPNSADFFVFALDAVAKKKYSGGTGEPNDPYQIATAADLIALGEDSDDYEMHFLLTADIDLDPNLPGGRVFQDALIARDGGSSGGGHGGASFEGVLDGRGYTIANLHIEGKPGYDAGLFGMLGGIVRDVNFTSVSVSGSPCGAIAGLNGRGMILRCRVSGQVSGLDEVGGLVGTLWDASIVECQAQVQVIGQNNVGGMVGGGPGGTLIRCEAQAQVNGERNVGGLVGESWDGQILECRAAGTAIGVRNVGGLVGDLGETFLRGSSADCDVTAEQTAGGLVGDASRLSGPLVSDCYARGSIAGSVVGGLAGKAGHNQFLNCYAACKLLPLKAGNSEPITGGLFGDVSTERWAPQTISCFWDTTLSGTTASAGRPSLQLGTGLTTQQMQDQQVFQDAGWDFSYLWKMCPGDYPTLQWQAQECNSVPK